MDFPPASPRLTGWAGQDFIVCTDCTDYVLGRGAGSPAAGGPCKRIPHPSSQKIRGCYTRLEPGPSRCLTLAGPPKTARVQTLVNFDIYAGRGCPAILVLTEPVHGCGRRLGSASGQKRTFVRLLFPRDISVGRDWTTNLPATQNRGDVAGHRPVPGHIGHGQEVDTGLKLGGREPRSQGVRPQPDSLSRRP